MDIQQPFVTQEQKVKFWTEAKAEIKQLQADNLKLREALAGIKQPRLMTNEHGIECLVYEFEHNPFSIARKALASPPAQSLQEHDDVSRSSSKVKADAFRRDLKIGIKLI